MGQSSSSWKESFSHEVMTIMTHFYHIYDAKKRVHVCKQFRTRAWPNKRCLCSKECSLWQLPMHQWWTSFWTSTSPRNSQLGALHTGSGIQAANNSQGLMPLDLWHQTNTRHQETSLHTTPTPKCATTLPWKATGRSDRKLIKGC